MDYLRKAHVSTVCRDIKGLRLDVATPVGSDPFVVFRVEFGVGVLSLNRLGDRMNRLFAVDGLGGTCDGGYPEERLVSIVNSVALSGINTLTVATRTRTFKLQNPDGQTKELISGRVEIRRKRGRKSSQTDKQQRWSRSVVVSER